MSADPPYSASGATRYTIEFEQPRTGRTEIRAITRAGEAMAVALATARLLMLNPDARFNRVRIVSVETDFEPDPEEDAVDYWNTA